MPQPLTYGRRQDELCVAEGREGGGVHHGEGLKQAEEQPVGTSPEHCQQAILQGGGRYPSQGGGVGTYERGEQCGVENHGPEGLLAHKHLVQDVQRRKQERRQENHHPRRVEGGAAYARENKAMSCEFKLRNSSY